MPAVRVLVQRLHPVWEAPLAAFNALGEAALHTWQSASYLVAVMVAVVALALRPSSWRRTVRDVLARQILFTALEALAFCIRIGFAAGIMIVVQAQLYLREAGGAEMWSSMFIKVIVRELGPLLANFLVIVRSVNAITTELAGMKLSGEVDVLDAQGIDPMTYLVMPRVVGLAISSFCLTVVFVVATFLSGYVVGALMGLFTAGPTAFFSAIFAAATIEDLYFFLPKTLLLGMVIGVICTTGGLGVRRAATEVPQAASRSSVRSLTATFAASAVLSLLIYGRILIFHVG